MSGRLYDKRAWRRASKAFLARNPLCRYCEQVGKTRLAQVVDHIKPVSEAPELAMVEDNWQPLCTTCHNPPGPIDLSRCNSCHPAVKEAFALQSPKAREYHERALAKQIACTDCHKTFVHAAPELELGQRLTRP